MAIVFQSDKFNIQIDSKMIIGVMGNYYDMFLSSLEGDNVYYISKDISISSKKINSLINSDDKKIIKLLREFNLDIGILNKRVCDLSHSEQRIVKYLLMIISGKKIIVIDEPFIDLDYGNKKKITILFHQLIKSGKSIIVGSNNSNDIYGICKKILFINHRSYIYGDLSLFIEQSILKKYQVDMPYLIEFVSLAKKKNINLRYSQDIRDLIKDVYRNVS